MKIGNISSYARVNVTGEWGIRLSAYNETSGRLIENENPVYFHSYGLLFLFAVITSIYNFVLAPKFLKALYNAIFRRYE